MLIKDINKDVTGYPSINITRKDPVLAAAISKMSADNNSALTYDAQGNRKVTNLSNAGLASVLSKRSKKNADIQAILKLLPDIVLSKQILISCILSPKDMTSTELMFFGPKDLFAPELASSVIARLKRFFDEEYKIKEILPQILEDSLFDKGSYSLAVIPENSIDEFINGNKRITTESMRGLNITETDGNIKSLGILGGSENKNTNNTNVRASLESLFKNNQQELIDNRIKYTDDPNDSEYSEYLTVTDNPSILKISKMLDVLSTERIKEQYSKHSLEIASESNDFKISDKEVDKLLYRNRNHENQPFAQLKTNSELDRYSAGNPLILRLPAECILPVHVPGSPEKQVGFFILLDQNGNPITDLGNSSQVNSNNNNSAFGSNLIRRVETNMGYGSGCFNSADNMHTAALTKVYSEMVEKDLLNRIKNGIHSAEATISDNQEIYRIMLARVLAKKYTQILYLPAEFVTYFAFKYDSSGIGKSLLDDAMTINTQRVVLMFTDMMATVKNSIGRTKITGTIDEKDPNPLKTIEKMMDETVRSRALNLPLSVSNPSDIIDFVTKAGYEWQFEGHPGIPKLSLDIQQINSNYAKVDSSLTDELRKASISSLGMTPELVDNGFNSEFAATAIANNVLLGKRVLVYQERFTPMLSNHVRQVANNSRSLIVDIKTILESNVEAINIDLSESYGNQIDDTTKNGLIVNKALNSLLKGFYVELPKPTSVTLQQQLDDLKVYTDALEAGLDAYVSSKFMTESTVGTLSNDVEPIRELIKAYLTRKYISEKGIMSELSELTNLKEDGNPQLDIKEMITSHLKLLTKSGVNAIVSLQKEIVKNNQKLGPVDDNASSEPISDGSNDLDGLDNPTDLGDDLDNTATPAVDGTVTSADESEDGEVSDDEKNKDIPVK